MSNRNSEKKEKPSRNIIRWILAVLFVVTAVAIAISTFRLVRSIVASWELTDLQGVVIRDEDTTPAPLKPGDPIPTPQISSASAPTPEPWNGVSRVTVLIMGLDYRDWEAGEGAPRTDTMILLTVDPVTKTGGMLSIPRDLWVNIPGFKYGKINTAYQLGEAYKLPGGGPTLAMQTVEGLLGVPIQYYAQIDFSAFVRFIDEIGGVKIEIPARIKVDLPGDGKDTIKVLKPGVQTLTGELALAYARARYTEGGDFDRASRQQQIILGIRKRVLSFNMVPLLLSKAPILYQEISSGVNTNLSLDQAIQLGMLAIEISEGSIQGGIIGSEHVTFGKSPDGLDILKPRPAQIRLLRDEIFTSEGAIGPMADGEDPLAIAQAENARIAILNGAGVPGLASLTAEYLRDQGLNAPEENLGDGEGTFYTTIIDHSGNPYTLNYLVKLMNVPKNNLRLRYEPGNSVDVEIILGNDWANNNPMP